MAACYNKCGIFKGGVYGALPEAVALRRMERATRCHNANQKRNPALLESGYADLWI